jgi:hypothetical protein
MWLAVTFVAFWVLGLVTRRVMVSGALKRLLRIELDYNPEYVPTDARAYPDADLAYYDETQRTLAAEGFSRCGDITDAALNRRSPAMRTFIRVLCDASGTTNAGIYHLPPNHHIGVEPIRVVEFETELSDGCYLQTSNAIAASAIELPPQIMAEWVTPASTPVSIWNRHRLRIDEAQRMTGAVPARTVDSLEKSIEASYRLAELKLEFRKQIGSGLTSKEVRRVAESVDGDTDAFVEAFANLRDSNRPGRP